MMMARTATTTATTRKPPIAFGQESAAPSSARHRRACEVASTSATSGGGTAHGRRHLVLGVSAALLAIPSLLTTRPTRAVAAVTIKPELSPDFTSFDRSDPNLKDVYYMIQDALRATDVRDEERLWTAVIDKYGSSEANWAGDAVGRAHGNRGNCLSRQGRFEAAIKDYNRSIELCPYSVDPVLNRGVAYEALREYKLAIDDYQSVLDVDPSDPAAWNNLGNANAALQNWDVALDAFKKATKNSNFFSFAAVNYATILFQNGNDQDAIREFRKILIKYPSFTDARAALAVALWLTGDRSGAETQW